MSAAEPLTGAWLEIAVVTDYGQAGESETLIGGTTEDVEIERDIDEQEWNEHMKPTTQRREGFETSGLSFEMIVTDQLQNFQDIGVIDSDGAFRRNVTHEAIYIHVYLRPSDTTPEQTYYAEDVQFILEGITFPMDSPATGEVTAWINGDHGFDQS